jgi:hypothetical protein
MQKWLIVVSVLVTLISACTNQVTPPAPATVEAQSIQPVASNTSASIAPVATTSPDLAATEAALPRPALPETATVSSACPGASAPRVAIGQLVTVVAVDSDKLKLRSEPDVSPDTILRELEPATQLKIVGGFMCVHSAETGDSYWFWKVEVIPGGDTGWVAEGDSQNYFIERSAVQQPLASIASTDPATGCPSTHAPYFVGQEVYVLAGDTDKLKLRSEPEISPDTVKMELEPLTRLKIVGGPMCVHSIETGMSYWFWKVEVISNQKTGWVAEGDGVHYFIESNMP